MENNSVLYQLILLFLIEALIKMGLLKDLQIGIGGYGKAIDFIFKNKLYFYFLAPFLLNVILFGSTLSLVGDLTEDSLTYIKNFLHPENWEFWGAEVLRTTLDFLVNLILYLFFFFLYAFLGGYIVLILLSPILSIVSEKTEKLLSGADYPFSWSQLLKDSWRGIVLASRNFLIETSAIVLLFFVSFIPVIGLLTTPALFLISSYYYGFSFIDYTSERRKLNARQRITYVKQNKGLAIGNGLPFALSLLIPFVGVSLSGFVAIISTVAATLSIFQKEQLIKQF